MAKHLCLSCGLCCDGSLFWAVPVEPGEDPPVALDEDGWLRQPCACFDGACTIYADRPPPCRSFDRRVLQIVQKGRRDAAWGRAQIAAMRQVLADLNKVLPGKEKSIYRRATDFLEKHRDRQRDPAFQWLKKTVLQRLSAYQAALAVFQVFTGRSGGRSQEADL